VIKNINKAVEIMKRGLVILAFAALLASLISSCKVVDPCPAYGNMDIEAQAEAQS